jgi:glycosyltransferase involved in cell wall biosynthesis
MNILFLSGESPIFPAGGIGVYVGYMAQALQAAGHSVFLLTWMQEERYARPASWSPFTADTTHVEIINLHKMMTAYAPLPYCEALSHQLSERVMDLADRWDIEVIESVDFHAPGLIAFQKTQSSRNASRRLLATFNHGFHEIIADANQVASPPQIQANINAERKMLGASDLIIAPSHAAAKWCRSLSSAAPVEIVREPYIFGPQQWPGPRLTGNVQYHGRLSIQKGLDRLIYAVNVVDSVLPVEKIEFIGGLAQLPFAEQDALTFLRHGLSRRLNERVVHHPQTSRRQVLEMLEPGAISPRLGAAETFSYASIEAVDAGAVPIFREGTAMMEFLPPDLRRFAFDEGMRSPSVLAAKVESILDNADRIVAGVRSYGEETLNPSVVAQRLADIYERALDIKRGRALHSVRRKPIGLEDITILLPMVESDQVPLETTLKSIAVQSAGAPPMILCQDGTDLKLNETIAEILSDLPDARLITQIKAGSPAVLNSLVENCATDLALILQPGDRLSPNALVRLVEAYNSYNETPDALIVPPRSGCKPNSLAYSVLSVAQARRIDGLRGAAALVSTQILHEIGFEATRRNGERWDWAFWLEFRARGYRAAILPDRDMVVSKYGQEPDAALSEGALVGTQVMIGGIVTP